MLGASGAAAWPHASRPRPADASWIAVLLLGKRDGRDLVGFHFGPKDAGIPPARTIEYRFGEDDPDRMPADEVIE